MTTRELIADEAELWHAATHHPFLDAVRDGTLDPAAFSRWLGQDYHFALALTAAEGRYLGHAPRGDLEILAQGIQAMVAELAWFERKAAERGPASAWYREKQSPCADLANHANPT